MAKEEIACLSNFCFYHNVFKIRLLQRGQKVSTCLKTWENDNPLKKLLQFCIKSTIQGKTSPNFLINKEDQDESCEWCVRGVCFCIFYQWFPPEGCFYEKRGESYDWFENIILLSVTVMTSLMRPTARGRTSLQWETLGVFNKLVNTFYVNTLYHL